MKKLLNIGVGLFGFSLLNIAGWLLIGITLKQPEISNVFSLTYPLQCLSYVFVSIFATGANIKSVKQKNKNPTYSGLIYGAITGLIVYGTVSLCINSYINFMNMDVATYKIFALYSIAQIFLQLILSLVVEKLNFEEKEKQGSLHFILFNILNISSLLITSLVTKNQIIVVCIPLVLTSIYAFTLYFCQFKKFKFEFGLWQNIKYESANIVTWLFLFVTYLFGYSNAFSVDESYIASINFTSLITDAQWDATGAISTTVKIDVANENYNHKKSVKNSFIYSCILVLSSLVMFVVLFSFYQLNLKIVLIIMAFQYTDFLISPFFTCFGDFYQLKVSPAKNTIIETVGQVTRFVLSAFLPTVFCTEFGQVGSSILCLVVYFSLRFKYFKLDNNGCLIRNKSN